MLCFVFRCVCLFTMCAPAAHRELRSLRTGVTDGSEWSCGCWELNLGRLEEQSQFPSPRTKSVRFSFWSQSLSWVTTPCVAGLECKQLWQQQGTQQWNSHPRTWAVSSRFQNSLCSQHKASTPCPGEVRKCQGMQPDASWDLTIGCYKL